MVCPKRITARRLPAAGAAAASITLQHVPSVSTRLGTGGYLLQQLGAMSEPPLGQLVCGIVQPVPVGGFKRVLGQWLDALAIQLSNAPEPAW